MLDSHVIWPPAGRYIVAVSGGADSMVLLHMLAAEAPARGYQLVVAHFDHGLRSSSAADAELVQAVAAAAGLPFALHRAGLGAASEAAARTARHRWLERQRVAHGAAAILTAHHQDDLIETSLLNLARGSGRRGLAPMQTSPAILRPLLRGSREQLREYATRHNLLWHEDPTNADINNPRNFLRHKLLSTASPEWRASYLENINTLAKLNTKIDQSLSVLLGSGPSSVAAPASSYCFARSSLVAAPDAVIAELVVAAALRLRPGLQLSQRLLADIAQYVRTARGRTHRPLREGVIVSIRTPCVYVHLGPLPKP